MFNCRYGSPVRMGVGNPKVNLSPKKEISSSSPSVPAMGVRQLLSPLSLNQNSVLQKAALFENGVPNQAKKLQKDPAELPLSQRKALFEKNASTPVLPKAPFALPVPPRMLQEKKPTMPACPKVVSNLPHRVDNQAQQSLKKGKFFKSAEHFIIL